MITRGVDLHRLGDFNGDGWDDLLERGADLIGATIVMTIRITSGRDGSILSSGAPLPLLWNFGNIAPLGDMNGDGKPDYGGCAYAALTPWNTQQLVVVSSVSHQILWSATIPNAWSTYFGAVLCGDLDVDNDGLNDVVTSAYYLSPGGTIIVYDHFGAEKYRLVDPVPGWRVGLDLASLQGDLDGDGCDDFVSTATGPQGGAILCFSGRTGAVLQMSHPEQPNDGLVSAGACGDIDRDGFLDYCGGGSSNNGVVTAFSGATGLVVHSWRDLQHCCMGINVTGGQDLDSDGVPDLIAGQISTSPSPNDRTVSAFSGRDGTFLARWYRTANGFTCLGESVAMLRPPPGEHYGIAVFAERCWSSTTNTCTSNALCPGVVWAYSCAPSGVREYGLPDASPGQPLAQSGMRALTPVSPQTVRFTMSEAPAGSAAILMLGQSASVWQGGALPVMLDPLGFPGITLWQSADVAMFTVAGASGPGRGYAQLQIQLPVGRTIQVQGTPFHAQWIWLDPTNLQNHGTTAGQRFRVQ